MTALGIQSYRRTSIKTADRRKIVVMLYEGMIKNINVAISAIAEKDTAQRTASVKRTLDIIQFLSAALDRDGGGEIAGNLGRLYDYIRDIVTAGNIASETPKLQEAIALLNVLLDGWREILNEPVSVPGDNPSSSLTQESVVISSVNRPTRSISPSRSAAAFAAPSAVAPSQLRAMVG